jgi:hypothetical protein
MVLWEPKSLGVRILDEGCTGEAGCLDLTVLKSVYVLKYQSSLTTHLYVKMLWKTEYIKKKMVYLDCVEDRISVQVAHDDQTLITCGRRACKCPVVDDHAVVGQKLLGDVDVDVDSDDSLCGEVVDVTNTDCQDTMAPVNNHVLALRTEFEIVYGIM